MATKKNLSEFVKELTESFTHGQIDDIIERMEAQAVYYQDSLDDGNPEERFIQQETQEKLEKKLLKAMKQLDDQQYLAICLKFYHDFLLDDIADRLDTTVVEVQRIISQTLNQLKDSIQS